MSKFETEEEWLSLLEKESIVFNAERSRWLIICQKLHAANVQICRAIELYLDHQDYVCATTLAGAANGLLREMLIEEYNQNTLETVAHMASSLNKEPNVSRKEDVKSIIRAELHPVNWLKHYLLRRGQPPVPRFFDEDDSAYNTLLNALCNYADFVELFSEKLSIEIREDWFIPQGMRRWDEHWGSDEGIFSW